MHVAQSTKGLSKSETYQLIATQLAGLLDGERDGLANSANLSALLYESLPEVNWVGFYFLRGSGLVVGPFQGKVACVRIPVGSGVCGTVARDRRTIIVPDVNAFPGHIACDAASRSEVVVPLVSGNALIGVLDIDSPRAGRFDEADGAGLERIAALLVERSDWNRLVES